MKTYLPQRLLLNVDQNRLVTPVVVILLQIAIFDSLVSISSDKGGDSSVSRQLLWGGLGLLSVVYLTISFVTQREMRFSFGGWPIASILVYIFASLSWSVTPIATAKRAMVFTFLIILCGITVGAWNSRWRRDSFSLVLSRPMLWLISCALLLTAVDPNRVFTEIGWRGVSGTKNETGQMMAVTVLLLLYGACHERLGKKQRITLIAVAGSLLLLTKSTTALLALIFAVGMTEFLLLRSTLRRYGSWRVGLLSITLVASLAPFLAYQAGLLPSLEDVIARFFSALGKSETLTGRTEIWAQVLGESRFHNPWLGGGYGAFWGGYNSISRYVRVGAGLYPGQAHNGYIDIYNDLGMVGLILLSIITVVALSRNFRLNVLKHPEVRLHLSIIFLCLFLNLGESTLFRNTQFMNIIFLASFIRTTAILQQAQSDTIQSVNDGSPNAKTH